MDGNGTLLCRGGKYCSAKTATKIKVDAKWRGPGIIKGRFGNKFDLLYYRCSTIETDLNYPRAASIFFDFLGFGGTSHFHLPNTTFHMRYLVGSKTLV